MKSFCPCCDKIRKDVISRSRDSNGQSDFPDMCFLCRKEAEKGRYWSSIENKYTKYTQYYWE